RCPALKEIKSYKDWREDESRYKQARESTSINYTPSSTLTRLELIRTCIEERDLRDLLAATPSLTHLMAVGRMTRSNRLLSEEDDQSFRLIDLAPHLAGQLVEVTVRKDK